MQFCLQLVSLTDASARCKDKAKSSGIPSAIFYLAVAALTASARSAEPARGVNSSESDSAGIALVTIVGDVANLPSWNLASEPDLEISGDAEPYLGQIGEVEFLSDGSLLVEDHQTDELRLFDLSGDVERLVGGPGSGPGEFQSLTELTVTPGDTAYTYDRRLYRISVFGPDGDLLRTVALTREDGGYGTLALDAWALDSEHLLLHRLGPYDTTNAEPHPRRDERDALLFALDGKGGVRAGPIRFNGGYSAEFDGGDAAAPFANRPAIAVGAGSIVHGSARVYQLTVSTPDLKPKRIIRWSGWEEPLTNEEVQAARDTIEAGLGELQAQRPDLARRLVEAMFSPNILPEIRPALGPIFIDEEGRLWVSRFIPTTNQWSQEDAWHLLDSDGRPLARVPLPPRARLAAVRKDRVALIMRDALDVEHLRVFRLIKGDRDAP